MIRSVSLILFLLALAWPLRAATLDIAPGQGIPDLKDHLVYASDPVADLATMLARYRAEGFGPDLALNPLATNFAPETWAAVDLVNATLDDGRAPDPFVLTLSLPLASGADIYLIRESGLTEALLTYSIFAPFDPGQHAATSLQTPAFTLAPGERATLMVKLYFGPFQSFRLALQTLPDLQAATFAAGVGLTAFYVFSGACMLFFLAFFVALRDWVSLLYAQLFLVGLALIGYIDGLVFRYLYPGHPEWQSAVGFGLLYGLSAAGFLLSAQSLWQAAPRAARLSLGLAAVSVAGYLAALASPGTYAAFLAYVLLGVMAVALLFGNGAWRDRHGGTHRAAKALAAVTVLAIAGIALLLAIGPGAVQVPQAIKATYLTLLIATIANFAAQILHIRRQHAVAVADKLAALSAEAQRSRELLAAEQAYSRARDLAQTRQRQLATASHDLRQPLTSLRMTLDSLGPQMDPALRARMIEAFDYMEQLSGSYLDEATTTDAPAPPESSDPYPLSLILETTWQMFHDEAVSKGLRLRRVPSETMTDVPPLALMRIVSNLISNAVRYTTEGGVLAGVRRRKTGPEIWVCDTGPGMTQAEIDKFRTEGAKGAASEGHGLGLAVCFDLAERNDLRLTVDSVPGRGTVFRLGLPVPPTEEPSRPDCDGVAEA